MHIYNRRLSPLRENYQQCNPATPYEDNFLKFSSSESGLFETMQSFKTHYLQNNENVKLTSKYKHFQTFSLVEPKPRKIYRSASSLAPQIKIESSREVVAKRNTFQDNIMRLKAARSQRLE